jgi:hypothetical protein
VHAEAEEAEDAARWVHWANALADGQARRTVEEYHSQRALQREQAEMLSDAARTALPSQPAPA